jgi:uncharacterized protein YbjQ (UPF0145 family)
VAATEQGDPFATTPQVSPLNSEDASAFPSSEGAPSGELDPFAQQSEFQASDFSVSEPPQTPEVEAPPAAQSPPKAKKQEPQATLPPDPPFAPTPSQVKFKKDTLGPSKNTLDQVKQYSEQAPIAKPAVPASFPFSLLIEGPLRPEEKEKLLTLLEDHQMGFRTIDLEPQLEGNRILIPRISEYAGVLLIQALRGARADIKLGPSDSIFATAETRNTQEEAFSSEMEESITTSSHDLGHPAENIPITQHDRLPGSPILTLIDTVSASAALNSSVVEAEHSAAFQEIVEALQRELKYKAYRKGATAILNYKIQVNSLNSPTHYRILAGGSAVKPAKQEQEAPPRPEELPGQG